MNSWVSSVIQNFIFLEMFTWDFVIVGFSSLQHVMRPNSIPVYAGSIINLYCLINSVWPNHSICCQTSWSISLQVMAYCSLSSHCMTECLTPGIYFCENLSPIKKFSFKKRNLKMLLIKCWPLCHACGYKCYDAKEAPGHQQSPG